MTNAKNPIDKGLIVILHTTIKYLKAKIKSYNQKISANFNNNKVPKQGFQWISLSIILINSVLRAGSNDYLQVFLKEWKYHVKEKEIPKYIIDKVEISSDSDREHSD